jgi:hypothetical protein
MTMMTLAEARKICAALKVRCIDFAHLRELYDKSDPKVEPCALKGYSDEVRPIRACPIFMLLWERKTKQWAMEVIANWDKYYASTDPIALALNLDLDYLIGFTNAVADTTDQILRSTIVPDIVAIRAKAALAAHLLGHADGQRFIKEFLGGKRV